MIAKLIRVFRVVILATILSIVSTITVSAATTVDVNPDANATLINRMTIEMGGVYFYNTSTTSDAYDGWVYKAVNATCADSKITIDTDQIAPYKLTYAINSGSGCSAYSDKAIGIDQWDARRFTVFGKYQGDVLSTKADVKTAFKKSSVAGLSVDTYVQDVPASSCPSIIIDRGGGNWEFIPVMRSGPAEVDRNLQAVLGSSAICRVANGGVNTDLSPGSIFEYYGLPRTYGDGRFNNDFRLTGGGGTVTTFRLDGGVVAGVGIAGAGPLSALAVNVAQNPGSTAADKETCNIAGVGWIVCPIAAFVGKITDGMYTVVEQLLYFEVPNALSTENNPIFTVWSNFRNLANIAFVIALFMVILSQATSIGISAYGIQKMLPRIVASAILVNLSYYICIFGIDISNILGAGVDGLITTTIDNMGASSQDGFNLSSIIANALIGGGAVAGGIALTGATTGAIGSALVGLATTFGIAALIAVLTALVVLVGRQAFLIILIVLSPLAFVAYILPNTENLFDKWRKAFITMLVFYPLVALLFYGSQMAAAIMRSVSGNAFVDIFSIGVQAFPLFATPFLLKFSGGLLGKIAGVVNNPNKGPFDKMRKRSEAWQEDLRHRGQIDASTRDPTAGTGIRRWRNKRVSNRYNRQDDREAQRDRAKNVAEYTKQESRARRSLGEDKASDRAVEEAAEAAAESGKRAEQKAIRDGKDLSEAREIGIAARDEHLAQIRRDRGTLHSQKIARSTDEKSVAYVQASAEATMKKFDKGDVEEREILYRKRFKPGDNKSLEDEFKKAASDGDTVAVRALQNMMISNGSPGVDSMRRAVETASHTPGVPREVIDAIRKNSQEVHGQTLKAKANDVLRWATDTGERDIGYWQLNQESWNKLSVAELATQTQGSLEAAVRVGAITPDKATALLSDARVRERLGEGQIAALELIGTVDKRGNTTQGAYSRQEEAERSYSDNISVVQQREQKQYQDEAYQTYVDAGNVQGAPPPSPTVSGSLNIPQTPPPAPRPSGSSLDHRGRMTPHKSDGSPMTDDEADDYHNTMGGGA